jgi:misacylated tRNA(Ala) deacylase
MSMNNLIPTVVGELMCQQDTFLRTFSTRIVQLSSCLQKKLSNVQLTHSSEPPQTLAVVVLEDTILFPEGGGQPADRGTLQGYPVVDVQRHGMIAQHYVQVPSLDVLQVGQTVQLELDWERRWDATQQHSGQHLVSAIAAQSPFHWATASWYVVNSIKKEE